MRTRSMVTGAVLLSGLWAASAMAAEGGGAPTAAPPGQEQAVISGTDAGAPAAEVGVPGTVPQVQLDLAKKREEARKRLEEGLKVRAQMMQTGQ